MSGAGVLGLPPVDLVVLGGGRGSRLGGADKAALVVAGRTLLERVLQDVDLGGGTVVVSRTRLPVAPAGRVVLQTLEDPPDGGPVAGLAAGLAALAGLDRPTVPEWVAVTAVDQPGAAQALAALRTELARLPRAAGEVEALSQVDDTGHRQWLLALYRRESLEAALRRVPDVRGTSVRRLVSGLAWHEVAAGAEHVGDVDTWADLDRWL